MKPNSLDNYQEELLNVPNNDPEDLTPTPEKKKLTKKQKVLAAAAIFLAIGCFGGGVAATMSFQNHNAAATSTVEATQSQEQTKAVPEEAKNFMKNFGDRFSDPLSTYYAEKAYEDSHNGGGILLSDDYISTYKITYDTTGETSELGFTKFDLKFDKNMDQAGSMDIFNNHIAVNLNRYMNMVAKNPEAKAKTVLDCQFLAYCELMTPNDVNPSEHVKLVDGRSKKLLSAINSIVSKYGSAANYKIAPASNDDTKKDVTLFSTPTRALVDTNNKVSGYQDNGVRLVIDIDIYKDKEVSHAQEVIDGVQLDVTQRALGDTHIAFGFGQN